MNYSLDADNASVELLVADLADEFRACLARGESPDPDEYAARHPEIADLVRDVLGTLRLSPVPAPITVTATSLLTPGVLGDFKIVREIGRGGMGVVYEARQISLNRRVALKVLPFAALSDSRMLQRFRNEAQAAAALDHAHVVKVHAVGEDRGVHFLAMQFIDGRPLSDLIRERRTGLPLPASGRGPGGGVCEDEERDADTTPVARASTVNTRGDAAYFRQVAEWGAQAADALEHAHSMGVVHRDVKPGNLLLDKNGQVWVADFGLAKLAASDAGVTMSGDTLGTLRYMSPEQALAKHGLVDHRTDVYALGATLYELLVGQPVVGGTDKAEILRKIIDEEPVAPRRVNRAIPIDLETIVLKCLRKEANDRYASAKELADDLRRFVRGVPVVARPVGNLERGRRWITRHSVPISLSALTCLAFIVAIAMNVRNSYREETDRIALQAAADRLERDEIVLRATRDAAERERFFALLERVRQRRADPTPGWSVENMADLRALSAMPEVHGSLHDLRTEVSAALSALDLVPAGTLGPKFPASAMDYSSDNRWLAVGRWWDLVVRLYDPATGKQLRELEIRSDEHSQKWTDRSKMPDRVTSMKFSPDARWLVAGTGSGRLAVWDTQSWSEPRVWAAHTDSQNWEENQVFTAVFRKDGKTFYSSARTSIRSWSLDGAPFGPAILGYRMPCALPSVADIVPVSKEHEGSLHLLDLSIGKAVSVIRDEVRIPLTVGPGGRLMAYRVYQGGPPLLQATRPSARAKSLVVTDGAPVEMAVVEYMLFDPPGGLLVTVENAARRLKLWDTAAGRLVAENVTAGDAARAAFTLDGRRVAISGTHGVALFDIPNRVLDSVATIPDSTIVSMSAPRDHSALHVTGRGDVLPERIYHWRAEAGRFVQSSDEELKALCWPLSICDCSWDNRFLAYGVGGVDSNYLCTNFQKERRFLSLQAAVFGKNDRLWILEHDLLRELVLATKEERVVWRNDPEAARSGIVLRTLEVGANWVLVGRRDGHLIRIDPVTGTPTQWPLLTTPIAGMALAPDESRLLVGGEGGEVRLVDPVTGDAVKIPDAHRGSVPGVAFGRHFFVTGSADRRVRLWTLDGKPIASLRMSGPVKKILLSTDESSLLVHVEGERAIRRWRLDVLFKEWANLGLAADLPDR